MTDATSTSGPLTDEEIGELGKSLGTLVVHVMRARQDNPEAGTMSVLSTLAKCGPIRSSDLAQTLFLDLSTVSRHVQTLERAGYLAKVADPSDRRAMTLHLTPEGKEHVEQFWAKRIGMMRDSMSHWEPDDVRTLRTLLDRYIDDFGAMIAKSRAADPKKAEKSDAPDTSETSENTGSTEDESTPHER